MSSLFVNFLKVRIILPIPLHGCKTCFMTV